LTTKRGLREISKVARAFDRLIEHKSERLMVIISAENSFDEAIPKNNSNKTTSTGLV
jgi:hypothetical protein